MSLDVLARLFLLLLLLAGRPTAHSHNRNHSQARVADRSPAPVMRAASLLLLLAALAAAAGVVSAFITRTPIGKPLAPRSSSRLHAGGVGGSSSLQSPVTAPALLEDEQGRTRLPWKSEGYNYWSWNASCTGHRIHFVAVETEGARSPENAQKPPIVLIHGFGASVFHWRYNIPALAQSHRVYAIDLLGFGLSDKPLTEYNAEVWRSQLAAFLQEVVGVGGPLGGAKAIVVGNSLGGYTALAAASFHPELVHACAVLNGAGTFEPDIPPEAAAAAASTTVSVPANNEKAEKSFLDTLKQNVAQVARRVLLYSAFYYTKNPFRIKQVLQQVYLDKRNVDEELVESIRYPSLHPNAAEVFYRVVTRTSTQGALTTINQLLNRLEVPLLLLWGAKDPWISPRAAERMKRLYPAAKRVDLEAGHCPHDEAPDLVNAELLNWVEELSMGTSAAQ